jgi:hypothetical protein
LQEVAVGDGALKLRFFPRFCGHASLLGVALTESVETIPRVFRP